MISESTFSSQEGLDVVALTTVFGGINNSAFEPVSQRLELESTDCGNSYVRSRVLGDCCIYSVPSEAEILDVLQVPQACFMNPNIPK